MKNVLPIVTNAFFDSIFYNECERHDLPHRKDTV